MSLITLNISRMSNDHIIELINDLEVKPSDKQALNAELDRRSGVVTYINTHVQDVRNMSTERLQKLLNDRDVPAYYRETIKEVLRRRTEGTPDAQAVEYDTPCYTKSNVFTTAVLLCSISAVLCGALAYLVLSV